jgi:hypothetical protein
MIEVFNIEFLCLKYLKSATPGVYTNTSKGAVTFKIQPKNFLKYKKLAKIPAKVFMNIIVITKYYNLLKLSNMKYKTVVN